MNDELSRCGGCGLSDDEARWVTSELYVCPTCEHRDRQYDKLGDNESRAGLRNRYKWITDPDEAAVRSSWALYTPEGHQARLAALRNRPARTPDGYDD